MTDADSVRFGYENDRICDYARPDEYAGLHKHAVEHRSNVGIIQCIACGKTRTAKPEDFGKWYMVNNND